MGLSSTIIVAVPSSADSWTQVGTIVVPQGMKRAHKVEINIAPDNAATNLSVRNAPVVRLLGDGLTEQTPHEFLGPFGALSGTTAGCASQEKLSVEHMTDIPVSAGGTIEAQVNTLDEAITAGTVTVAVYFDDKAPTQKNSMSQYVDAALDTTADRWTNIGTIRIPLPESGKAPSKISEILIGVAPDQGTSSAAKRISPRIRITGDGLKTSGTREYVGPTGQQIILDAVGGGAPLSNMTKRIIEDLEINAGGQLLIEQRQDVEAVTAGTIAVQLRYQ